MQISSNDFIEARKVSLTTLEVVEEVVPVAEQVEEVEEVPVEEYIPTSNLLLVRNMALALREEEETFPTATKAPETIQSVNEKLYEETMKGKEEAEREEPEELVVFRG